ncbi:hypothetical protein L7F22_028447 [Adiantum nelumboides]|nr:hypothetical protein [Adiantum nelumboides]
MEDPPEVEGQEEVLQPESVLRHEDKVLRNGEIIRRYLIKFKNYPFEDAKWMQGTRLKDSLHLVNAYNDSLERVMAWTAACRRPLSRLVGGSHAPVAPSQRTSLRYMSADHHGPPKVNFWEDPMSPSKWKEEHFVLISLAGWGLFGYGAYKGISSLVKKPPEKEEVKASH